MTLYNISGGRNSRAARMLIRRRWRPFFATGNSMSRSAASATEVTDFEFRTPQGALHARCGAVPDLQFVAAGRHLAYQHRELPQETEEAPPR
jgi:hypothetical protein